MRTQLISIRDLVGTKRHRRSARFQCLLEKTARVLQSADLANADSKICEGEGELIAVIRHGWIVGDELFEVFDRLPIDRLRLLMASSSMKQIGQGETASGELMVAAGDV